MYIFMAFMLSCGDALAILAGRERACSPFVRISTLISGYAYVTENPNMQTTL